ncbi:MAG: hypothetical protein ACRDJ9_05365 [Dehalococcoidia bacterium]
MRGILTFGALAATTALWSAACRSGGDQGAADGVKAAITAAIQSQGDSITVTDPGTGQPVTLVFDHVHESVDATAGGRDVACVDFHAADGRVFDVDYYVGRRDGKPEVQDYIVHKVDGREVIASTRRARLDSTP